MIGQFRWKFGKVWHSGIIESIEESEGDDYFLRYYTDTMVGGMSPLIKYSRKTQRVYFLTERSFEGLISFPEFETAGCIAKMDCSSIQV